MGKAARAEATGEKQDGAKAGVRSGAVAPAIGTKTFRSGMSRLGAAVTVLTTDGPAGRFGMTATAVTSVTDTPPTLLVCINRDNFSHDRFRDNGVLCVNVLADRHRALSETFAGRGKDSDSRFATAEWERIATGAPVLADAVVAFDTRIVEATEVGTHSVFFCEVEDMRFTGTAESLIYFDRTFHPIAPRGTWPGKPDDGKA